MLKKKCKAILLPTDIAKDVMLYHQTYDVFGRAVFPSSLDFSDNPTYIRNTILINSGRAATNSQSRSQLFNLYICLDTAINAGDWIFNTISKKIIKSKRAYGSGTLLLKVIATIDPLLLNSEQTEALPSLPNQIPTVSKSFLIKYANSFVTNKIEDVMVEFEYVEDITKEYGENGQPALLVPRLRNNEIIITKCKDSWDREELDLILDQFAEKFVANSDTAHKQKEISDWKEQNL